VRSNQYLAAGLVDELELHVVPLVLGGGAQLFDGLGPDLELEQVRAIEAPGVTHLKYRVVRRSTFSGVTPSSRHTARAPPYTSVSCYSVGDAATAPSPEQTTKHGAFMEQSGRNRWQPMTNATAARTAEIGENRCRGLRPVAGTPKW
jgi:hypothetical protein